MRREGRGSPSARSDAILSHVAPGAKQGAIFKEAGMARILVLGGDGFCGWPTALHLSRRGHDITIVDTLSRRRIDGELGIQSLTPIRAIEERLAVWKEVAGPTIA